MSTASAESKNNSPLLRIASRGSDLALWQANFVSDSLRQENPDLSIELVIIKTSGDRIQDVGLDKVEGTGFFTTEVEAALLDGRADVAVHSFKDLPTAVRDDLGIFAVPPRAPAADVLVMRKAERVEDLKWGLKKGATVGTCSLRRRAQLLSIRPDLKIVDLRGNVPTRMAKVQTKDMDAVCLAQAGLDRLKLSDADANPDLHFCIIDKLDVTPAPSQGALGIQCRMDDKNTQNYLRVMHDPTTALAIETERALLSHFGGGCHLPLGVYCTVSDVDSAAPNCELFALVAAPDGTERIEVKVSGSSEEVVKDAHSQLTAKGAGKYI